MTEMTKCDAFDCDDIEDLNVSLLHLGCSKYVRRIFGCALVKHVPCNIGQIGVIPATNRFGTYIALEAREPT